MNILNRLRQQEKQVVWGIRALKSVKLRLQLLAASMRVPTNRLVVYVLQDWVRQNADVLADESSRNRLADRINQAYLKKQLN